MPGGDGTGPLGQGSMTGRGMGFCAGSSRPGYDRGNGFGRGFGRRFLRSGRRFWDYPYFLNIRNYDNPTYRNLTPYPSEKEEKSFLEEMVKDLQSKIEDLKNRIQELSRKKEE